ncbi:MAG: GNAT family N-acetyltransferase [Fimbriimonadaceae bacterium]|nr:GNAT family N-acetyltransferase [Fimbriimonadaceae bacterium]QYK59298.1 MAG: GNAT family N-acetyltransferase [Fimbriimonadaceae bacterium]
MTEWFQPATLQGHGVVVEPLSLSDAASLFGCCAQDTFRFFTDFPASWDLAGFEEFLQRRLETGHPVVFRTESRETLGMSSFFDIRPDDRALEIGYTWLTESARGTHVNPAVKLLMIGHAIEKLGALRVQLKTDARNERSRAAILKLGATYEGTLRNYVLMRDGHRRATAFYSILPEEWPLVRQRLLERLDRLGC